MKKIIISNELNKVLMTALNDCHKERHFTFSRDPFPEDEDVRRFKLSLNWEALGSLSPVETARFARELQNAAFFAERINTLNLYYRTTKDKLLAEEKLSSVSGKLKESVRNEDYALLYYFLAKVGEEVEDN